MDRNQATKTKTIEVNTTPSIHIRHIHSNIKKSANQKDEKKQPITISEKSIGKSNCMGILSE